MAVIKLTIPGEPSGKARARVTKTGIAYTPKPTVDKENLIRYTYSMSNQEKLNGELMVSIKAYFSIPKSVSKTKREQMARELIRPTKKPDTDNVAKLVLDSLNKLAYHDDSSVVELRVGKYYSDNPRIEVEITEVN